MTVIVCVPRIFLESKITDKSEKLPVVFVYKQLFGFRWFSVKLPVVRFKMFRNLSTFLQDSILNERILRQKVPKVQNFLKNRTDLLKFLIIFMISMI